MINKNISVWRGDQNPPTEYHLWLNSEGKLLAKINEQWEQISGEDIPLASDTVDGLMSVTDKVKVNNYPEQFVLDLGILNSQSEGEIKAAKSEVAGNRNISFIRFQVRGVHDLKTFLIMQWPNGINVTAQIMCVDKAQWRRNVTGATGVEGAPTNAYPWERTAPHKIDYDEQRRMIKLKDYENQTVSQEVELPLATSSQPGLMSSDDKTKLDCLAIDTTWAGQHANAFTEAGEFHIYGERTNANDGLPILNSGSGHTIDARLTVLDSSLTNGTGEKTDTVVTQILRLSNRTGGDGHVYVRTAQAATKSQLATPSSTAWGTWEKLMGVFEKNAVSNATDLNEYTSSGMYDGMFVFSSTSQTAVSGLKIENGSTFLMVSVNGYAVAQTGVVPQVTQLLYVMPSGLDGSSGVRNAKVYTRTGIYVASTKTYTWGKFDGLAQASDITKLLGYIQDNSDLIQENQSAITANTKEIARVNSLATQAQESADRAQEAANTAQTTADSASSAATTAQTAADNAQETATAASAAAAAAKQAAENEATARTEADAELQLKIGELSDLNTIEKTSIVNAINEVKQSGEGIKEYKLLHSHTFTEDATSSDYELLTADDGTPIHQYKDILIFAELSYVEGGSTLIIYLNIAKDPRGRISNIANRDFSTTYIFKLKIDGMNTTLYSENHTNSFFNGQYSDGNQGVNLIGIRPNNVFTYDRLTINFPFKANNKISIYGR